MNIPLIVASQAGIATVIAQRNAERYAEESHAKFAKSAKRQAKTWRTLRTLREKIKQEQMESK
jgi:hypothetical protein